VKPWIKAGLIGGVLQIVFTLPSLAAFYLPLALGGLLSILSLCFFLFLYPLPGVLDVHWTSESRTERQAMGAGALAGLLSTVIYGAATLIMVVVLSLSGGFEAYLRRLMPEAMDLIQESGMSFLFSTGVLLAEMSVLLLFHAFLVVAISTLGSVVYSGAKGRNK
jgi:hypothetical protein